MATSDLGGQWLDRLHGAMSGEAEEVPEGWSTLKEIMAETGYTHGYVWQNLEKLVKQGRVEKRKFRIQSTSSIRPIFHYRFND